MDGHSLVVSLKGVVTAVLLELNRGVLVEELIDRQVTTTNSDVDLVLVHTDGDSLGTELVDTVRLTHEHDLELLSIGEVVDVLSETLVDAVSLDGDVDGNARLEVNNVLLQGLDLHHGGFEIKLALLKASENVKAGLLTHEVLPFKLLDVAASIEEFFLQVFFGLEHLFLVHFAHAELLFDVMEHSQFALEASDGSFCFFQHHLEGVVFISKSSVFSTESIVVSNKSSLKFTPLSSLSLVSSVIFSNLSLEFSTG